MAMRLVGRDRRKVRIRKKVSGTQERPRLTVFRTARHIYAQVIDDESGRTLAHVSTLSKDVRDAQAVAELKVEQKAEQKVEGKSGQKPDKKSEKVEQKSDKKARKTDQASLVGSLIARMCLSKDIRQVVFDRNGYMYHGRVSALATAARKAGLKF
ncbi:MAG: 50S ribosomal protein L18 [Polyangiaceae bacterium]|nr:50S ribosomal protein L18 [Polyangiaceae bacterium]